MSLKQVFCNSPWFHLEIEQSGLYNFCSFTQDARINDQRIQDTEPMQFMNSHEFKKIRSNILSGQPIKNCEACYLAEQREKVFGRRKMLIRSGIFTENFEASLLQSPHLKEFEWTENNLGNIRTPIKFLKVNLGSTCNASCVYCHPKFSNRLANDYIKLGWTNDLNTLYDSAGGHGNFHKDSDTWQKFLSAFDTDFSQVDFLQILGGETLYEPKFYELMDHLIKTGRSQHITLGVTTNGSVWRDDFVDYFDKFNGVSLGVSIDCDHPVNDYLRYPTKTSIIKQTISKFQSIPNVFVLLRPTPTLFSVGYLDTLVDYMMETGLHSETCQVLTRPQAMQVQVMPQSLRPWAIDRLERVLDKYDLKNKKDLSVVNTRVPEAQPANIANDILSYINILKNEPVISNLVVINQLKQMLQGFEQLRGNSIKNLAPEYKEWLDEIGI